MTAPEQNSRAVLVLSAHYPPDPDGIGDYTHFLANALARLRCSADIITSVGSLDEAGYPLEPHVRVHRVVRSWGALRLRYVLKALQAFPPATLFIQYAPHAYDSRGITLGPGLLVVLLRLLTRHRVIVNFHEIAIPFSRSWKHILGALWQRGTAALMGAAAHAISAANGQWREVLHSIGIRKPVTVIPVGSNIPREPITEVQRSAIRSRFLQGREGVLVGCFGSGADRDAGILRDALGKVENRNSLTVVWLGNSGFRPGWEDDTGIFWTGTLPHPEISHIMSSCDMFVFPFIDGVSTRRGTLAAALLHELPLSLQ